MFLRIYLIVKEELQEGSSGEERKVEKDDLCVRQDEPVGEMIKGDQSPVKQDSLEDNNPLLKNLADEICTNSSGRFYLLSFSFNGLKSRQSTKKNKVEHKIDKKDAYLNLVKSIYKTLSELQHQRVTSSQ